MVFAQRVRGRGVPVRWLNLACGNLLVLLFLLSLGALGGEVYYRFVYDTTDSLAYSKVSKRWFARHYHRNLQGCRDNVEYAPLCEPGKRRVSFVGDSFTAGHGVKDVNDVFALRLRKEHPEWEIHVLANPGFDTGDELRAAQACFTNGYQVGQVVLVYCLNDISDLVPEIYETFREVYDQSKQGGWLRQNSYLINTICNRFNLVGNSGLHRYFQLIRDAYRGPAWEKQQDRLKEFRDMVQSRGGKLSVVTFPFFDRMGPAYDYQFVHDELNKCWRDLGVPHLDLLEVYKSISPEKLVVDRLDAHPNEYAHALAAEAIGIFLREQMTAMPGPSTNHSNQAEVKNH